MLHFALCVDTFVYRQYAGNSIIDSYVEAVTHSNVNT